LNLLRSRRQNGATRDVVFPVEQAEIFVACFGEGIASAPNVSELNPTAAAQSRFTA
jgi:hypothetical protein